jgi:hypothetical protein
VELEVVLEVVLEVGLEVVLEVVLGLLELDLDQERREAPATSPAAASPPWRRWPQQGI